MISALHRFYVETLRPALYDAVAVRHIRFTAERRLRDAERPPAASTIGRAAELARELAAEVLEAIGVDAALEIEGREVPPVAAAVRERSERLSRAETGDEWLTAWQREHDATDPERQRMARTTAFALIDARLWLAGLADADLLDGAKREADALRAAERWTQRRLEGRKKGKWEDAEGAIAGWRASATQRAAEAEAVADDADRAALLWEPWTAGHWGKRIIALAQMAAKAEGTARAPAVIPPVVHGLFDPKPKQQGMWTEDKGVYRLKAADRLVATLPPEAAAVLTTADASKRLNMLQTAPGRKFVRHLITEGQRAEFDGEFGEKGAPVVTFVGGWEALKDKFGHSDSMDWKKLLQAGLIQWEYNGGGGNFLWAYDYTRGVPGKPGVIEVTLGKLFRRNVVHTAHGDDQFLIPVLQHDPPIDAKMSRQHHPAVWRTQDRLLLHMVGQWRDATGAAADCYPVRSATLEMLAAEAGIPRAEWDRVLGAFVDGAGDVPPLLEVQTDGRGWSRLRLADAHAAERDFMAAMVQTRRGRSIGGQTTAKRKGRKRGS
jgi:hypothetical protein